MGTSARNVEAAINPSEIEAFLKEKRKTGRPEGTLEKYRRDLLALYEYLPEDKLLTEQALAQWRSWMKKEGYEDKRALYVE